jgi:catechol 2,3-dioxygenase-like lactoylglutathione lyase family enzyme
MSSLTSIAPVLHVADLNRSIAYYRDRLGFAIDFVYDNFYASLVRDGCHIHIKVTDIAAQRARWSAESEEVDATFGVKGAAALFAEFDANGATFTVRLRKMPYGTEFYVQDPDGYVLAFVE